MTISLPMAASAYTLTQGYKGSAHQGIDMAAPLGTPFAAADGGTVAAAGSATGFGQWIVLDHIESGKKYSTVYGHMTRDGVLVTTGQPVTKGQHIGNVGNNGESTGPHLHFEVWEGGRLTGGHSIDPMGAASGAVTASGGEASSDSSGSDGVTGFINAVSSLSTWVRVLEFIAGVAIIGALVWKVLP